MKRNLCSAFVLALLLVGCALPAPLVAPAEAPQPVHPAAVAFPSGAFDLKPYEGWFAGVAVPKTLT